jgi:hypothetical protein
MAVGQWSKNSPAICKTKDWHKKQLNQVRDPHSLILLDI